MSRRFDSIKTGGYAETVDVADEALDAVIREMPLTQDQDFGAIRGQIRSALENFKTQRAQTVKAKPVADDLRELKALGEATDPTALTAPLLNALESLESFKASNPVLYQRLKWSLGTGILNSFTKPLQDAEESMFAIGRTLETGIADLKSEIRTEDGRGRPTDYAALQLGHQLYGIWHQATGKGTSRQNAPDRLEDPFGEFVHSVGRLLEPDFKGHHVARKVHEARRDAPSGEN